MIIIIQAQLPIKIPSIFRVLLAQHFLRAKITNGLASTSRLLHLHLQVKLVSMRQRLMNTLENPSESYQQNKH